MKKFQILPLNIFLILSSSLISSSVFASEVEEIWSYVFLIPIYFVLILQSLLVLFALIMKHFKTKQTVLLSSIVAGIFMALGTGVTLYLEPLEKIWTLLLHFSLFSAIVFIFPLIQFKLLNKPENSPDENES